MIIKTDEEPKAQIARKIPWQAEFKLALMKRNNQALLKEKPIDHLTKTRRQMADAKFSDLLLNAQNQKIRQIYDTQDVQFSHSYYSSYVSLGSHYPVQDQYSQAFPYLRYLEENGRTQEKIPFYNEITNQLRQGKENGRLMEKWQSCFDNFLPHIGDLQAIDLYQELLTQGIGVFNKLYKQCNAKCKKDILLQRICESAKFFKEQQKIRKQISVSVQSSQVINLTNLSKTSKNLFCSVCLIYDCGYHKLDDSVLQNNFEYYSHRNTIKTQEKIRKSIKLIEYYQKNIFASSVLDIQVKRQNYQIASSICGQECYLTLARQKYDRYLLQRVKFMSPVVKAILDMGIRLFCYDPCKISKLFPPDKQKISCRLVFLYFIEEYDLMSRFENKFFDSEYQMLLNQRIFQPAKIKAPTGKNTGKRAPSFPKFLNQIKQKSFQIPTCCHHFIGKESIDLQCNNCSCHQRGFCLPQCLCSQNCPIMKIGCLCKNQDECRSRKCPCFLTKSECQPGICLNCFDNPNKQTKKKNKCQNDQIMRGAKKLIRVGVSTIPGAGLGAFAGQNIEPDNLVNTYTGQLINPDIDNMRQAIARDLSFYNFGSPAGTIDARFMGNKTRFINHANDDRANLRAQNVFSRGIEVVAFYAQKKILKGQELFFNYDGQGILEKNFKEKYPFIKKNNYHKNKK